MNTTAQEIETDPARPGPRRWRVRGLAATVVLLALALTALLSFRWGSSTVEPVAATPTASADSGEEEQPTVADIYASLAPSVVSITTNRGSGTGVIANADATVLTALHVVQGAKTIEISFADGSRTKAEVATTDPANDIATLTPATPPSLIVPAVLGGRAAIGDPVIAIGDQLGLTGSTTTGVVSGLGRSLAREDAENLSGLIQFDAAVNPGSSGGPLVNADGQIIGIVVALANPTDADTFIGIGFAVPIGAAVGGGGEGEGGRGPQV